MIRHGFLQFETNTNIIFKPVHIIRIVFTNFLKLLDDDTIAPLIPKQKHTWGFPEMTTNKS